MSSQKGGGKPQKGKGKGSKGPSLFGLNNLKQQEKATTDILRYAKKAADTRVSIEDLAQKGITPPSLPSHDLRGKRVKAHTITFDPTTGDLIDFKIVYTQVDELGEESGTRRSTMSVPSAQLYFEERVGFDLATRLTHRKSVNIHLGQIITIIEPTIWAELANEKFRFKSKNPTIGYTFSHFKSHLIELGLSWLIQRVERATDVPTDQVNKKTGLKVNKKVRVDLDPKVGSVVTMYVANMVSRASAGHWRNGALSFFYTSPAGEVSAWCSTNEQDDGFGNFPDSEDFVTSRPCQIRGNWEAGNAAHDDLARDQPITTITAMEDGETLRVLTKNLVDNMYAHKRGAGICAKYPSKRGGIGILMPIRRLPVVQDILSHQLVTGYLSDQAIERQHNLKTLVQGGSVPSTPVAPPERGAGSASELAEVHGRTAVMRDEFGELIVNDQ